MNKLESTLAKGVLLLLFCGSSHFTQDSGKPFVLKKRNLGGPRLGITYVLGDGDTYKFVRENDMDRIISQFGWHFEYQVTPKFSEGPSFVVQFVPLVGGVEYGKLVPSVTLAFGIRFPGGIEFGMGPNLIPSRDGISSSLIVAAGKSFDYGGVSIPLNIAYAINPDGNRASFIFGYALE